MNHVWDYRFVEQAFLYSQIIAMLIYLLHARIHLNLRPLFIKEEATETDPYMTVLRNQNSDFLQN
jgi:hypothetical protein